MEDKIALGEYTIKLVRGFVVIHVKAYAREFSLTDACREFERALYHEHRPRRLPLSAADMEDIDEAQTRRAFWRIIVQEGLSLEVEAAA
jgi:hypothetical protein